MGNFVASQCEVGLLHLLCLSIFLNLRICGCVFLER